MTSRRMPHELGSCSVCLPLQLNGLCMVPSNKKGSKWFSQPQIQLQWRFPKSLEYVVEVPIREGLKHLGVYIGVPLELPPKLLEIHLAFLYKSTLFYWVAVKEFNLIANARPMASHPDCLPPPCPPPPPTRPPGPPFRPQPLQIVRTGRVTYSS